MSEPHVFVRPATALDAQALGEIHVQTMRASLRAALGIVPQQADQHIDATYFSQSWSQAITAPPGKNFTLLVAVEEGRVVGFAAIAPTSAQENAENTVNADADTEESHEVAEITALEVHPDFQRRGHGSRLLAASVDSCRENFLTNLQTWILAGDDSRTSFLTSAGFAPAGLRRTLTIGEGYNVNEHCWFTRI